MLTEKPAWWSLLAYFDEIESLPVRDLLAADEQRFEFFGFAVCRAPAGFAAHIIDDFAGSEGLV